MDLNKFLSQVLKPTRYSGNEFNIVKKNWSGVCCRVALAYPDLYEVGMSNLAIKILYGILNNRPDVLAERVFAPWPDAEEKMRNHGILVYSLESRHILRDFDIIGFTIPYELCYTNILNILNLSDIPFSASERDGSYPLIIGGGPGAFNPEPLADFFDLFVLGDGEEIILELVDLKIEAKKEGWPKAVLLKKMAKLDGVYVPGDFKVKYYPDGTVQGIIPIEESFDCEADKGKQNNQDTQDNKGNLTDKNKRIRKRLAPDLNELFYPVKPVVSYPEAVHDRFSLEIARGCSRGCRFCQAGFIYRPVRERSLATLPALACDGIQHTGYEEISLISLSSSDYSQLEQLLDLLEPDCRSSMTAISLPSLRPGTLTPKIISHIKDVRKTGFTIAPEAGTQRLRNVINKGVSEEDIFSTVQRIFEQGWDLLKLYFMIGLPTEQEEDLDGIVRISQEIAKIGKRFHRGRTRINITISPFVPKSHTPFERWPQESIDSLQQKEKAILRQLGSRTFTVRCRQPEVSFLEAVFARADRRISQVISRAWALGARFDQWSEHFNFSLWERAFAETGLDPTFYANRGRGEHEILPWDHLSCGISPEFLAAELKRAIRSELTPDCRAKGCYGCGVCDQAKINIPPLPELTAPLIKEGESQIIEESEAGAKRDNFNLSKEKRGEKACKLRVKFCKKDTARFMSHLDLGRVFARAIRRADLPIAFSQGFHPLPMIAFSLPLPVGIEGLAEYADFIFHQVVSPDQFLDQLNQQLPHGLGVLQAKSIPVGARSLFTLINHALYQIRMPKEALETFQEIDHENIIKNFLAQEEILVQKKKDVAKKINLRPFVRGVSMSKEFKNELGLKELEEGSRQDMVTGWDIALGIGEESVNPTLVLTSMYKGLIEFSDLPLTIVRQGLYLLLNDHLWEPIEVI